MSRTGFAFEGMHGFVVAQVFQRMAKAMRSGLLSFSHIHALHQMRRLGPQDITALAEAVRLSHAATSRLVQRLVTEGFADRCEMPDNRRRKLVTLTESGREFLNELRRYTAEVYGDLLRNVPEDLIEELLAVLERLRPYLPQTPPMEANDS